ncbi:hypothetical protein [Kibdelosporangium philippinense]|uniref:hypothetical protein n=1 Tax=Kibdelosporangium philippinense TaxID=211113 RepID=UPI00361F8B8E
MILARVGVVQVEPQVTSLSRRPSGRNTPMSLPAGQCATCSGAIDLHCLTASALPPSISPATTTPPSSLLQAVRRNGLPTEQAPATREIARW